MQEIGVNCSRKNSNHENPLEVKAGKTRERVGGKKGRATSAMSRLKRKKSSAVST